MSLAIGAFSGPNGALAAILEEVQTVVHLDKACEDVKKRRKMREKVVHNMTHTERGQERPRERSRERDRETERAMKKLNNRIVKRGKVNKRRRESKQIA